MNHSVDYQHIKTTKNICSALKKVSRLAALDIFSDFGASFFGKQPENGIKLSTLLATLSLLSTAIFAHVVTNRRSVALQKKSENFIAKKTEPIILLSRSVLGLGSKGTLKRRIFIVSW